MKDLTQDSIVKNIVSMAAPIAAGMLFQTLYFLVDLYFVAAIGDDAVAGVGAAGTLMFIVMALTQVLGVGAVALIAQAVGRRDQVDANLVFNQSVLLARQISHAYKIPMDPFVLRRDHETAPQTQLAEDERRKNVRGAFTLNPDRSVDGKNILLVDDVYTSGATVNECSRILKRNGSKQVFVVTLARAVS